MTKAVRWLRRRMTYGTIVILAITVFVFLLALVAVNVIDAQQGSFIGTLLAALLTVVFIAEVREDRIAQHRPFVVVDIEGRVESYTGVSGRGESLIPSGTRLTIRNLGSGGAQQIKIRLNEHFKDARGADIMENPLMTEGIPFLGPGKVMSLSLAEENLLHLIRQRSYYQDGQQPPPVKPLEAEVTVAYEDAATGRRFEETHPLGIALHIHGWIVE